MCDREWLNLDALMGVQAIPGYYIFSNWSALKAHKNQIGQRFVVQKAQKLRAAHTWGLKNCSKRAVGLKKRPQNCAAAHAL